MPEHSLDTWFFYFFFLFVCFNLSGTEILKGELRAIIPQTEQLLPHKNTRNSEAYHDTSRHPGFTVLTALLTDGGALFFEEFLSGRKTHKQCEPSKNQLLKTSHLLLHCKSTLPTPNLSVDRFTGDYRMGVKSHQHQNRDTCR